MQSEWDCKAWHDPDSPSSLDGSSRRCCQRFDQDRISRYDGGGGDDDDPSAELPLAKLAWWSVDCLQSQSQSHRHTHACLDTGVGVHFHKVLDSA